MRICRIANYPRDNLPGSGLPTYFLAKYIFAPTLYITKHFPGVPREIGNHVELLEIKYPDREYYSARTFSGKLLSLIVKGVGHFVFFISCVYPMWKFKPDIVHVHGPLLLPQGIFSRLFLGSKVVVTFHGSDIIFTKKHIFIQWLVRFADKVVVVSKKMLSDLQGIAPEQKIVHIPSGVDLERFKDLGFEREKTILAIGSLRWQKGYSYLIDAVAHSFREFPDYKLKIVGEGYLRDEITERIKASGLDGNVELLGTLSRDEVASILNRAKIFVLSSVSEGFPKVLLEAIACGTPIVTTNVGSCPDAAEGVGIVVDKENSEQLATAIERLICDKELWNFYHLACADKIRPYDWRNIAQELETLYDELLAVYRSGTLYMPFQW